jgi:UDP-glucose:(heptosyl)LPS alpha-1,3-glucosyltransferase
MLLGSLIVWRRRRGVLQVTGAIVLNKADVIAVHYCHQVGTVTPSRSSRIFRVHVKATRILARMGERICYRINTTAMLVGVSVGVADEIRTHYPRVASRVHTIYNGVDTDAFAPSVHQQAARALRTRLRVAEGRLVAVFVGSEWERKGLQATIAALALAPGWDLVVVGAGDRERYAAIAEAAGVGDGVHWMGETRDVASVYELADAFVLPSSYETFSLVTFEAAASGLPVLATAVNGVRELLEDGSNGLLITQEPETIADGLRRLGDDAELRTRLGRAARDSALQFTWRRMVAEHEELYELVERDRQARLGSRGQ